MGKQTISKMKCALVVVLAPVLLPYGLTAQVAADYFIPKKPINKSQFYTPVENGRKAVPASMTYIHNNDSLELTTTQTLYGKSLHREYFVVKDDEILLYNEYVSDTLFRPSSKSYEPAQVRFKLPSKGKATHWYYTSFNKELNKCSAYFTMLTIKGKRLNCVRVDKTVFDENGKTFDWANSSEYYVQGMGLYKIEIQLTKDIFRILDYQKFDSVATKH